MADGIALEEIKKIAQKYAETLKHDLKISGVYLFGSSINGNFTQDSDIDVAVVSEDFTGDIIDDTFKLMKIRRKIDNRIEPHPVLLKDFNEGNPLVKELLNNNIKVA